MVIFFVSSQSYVPQSVVTEIYYTTTNGKPLSLDYSKFDVSVSGNVYDSNRDMFVLSFDGELSSIPAESLDGYKSKWSDWEKRIFPYK